MGANFTYVLTQDAASGKSVIFGSGWEYQFGTTEINQGSNAVELAGHYLRTSGGRIWRITGGGTTATPITGFTDRDGNETDIVKVVASSEDMLALDANGNVWGLGYNTHGQLGNNEIEGSFVSEPQRFWGVR